MQSIRNTISIMLTITRVAFMAFHLLKLLCQRFISADLNSDRINSNKFDELVLEIFYNQRILHTITARHAIMRIRHDYKFQAYRKQLDTDLNRLFDRSDSGPQ